MISQRDDVTWVHLAYRAKGAGPNQVVTIHTSVRANGPHRRTITPQNVQLAGSNLLSLGLLPTRLTD